LRCYTRTRHLFWSKVGAKARRVNNLTFLEALYYSSIDGSTFALDAAS
jgi:hypothetical protein